MYPERFENSKYIYFDETFSKKKEPSPGNPKKPKTKIQ